MAGTKRVVTQPNEQSMEVMESMILEQRKVKALEKIANSLDALTVWFEEIEKQEWSDRIQYYLYEFHNNVSKIAEGGEVEPKIVGRPKKDSEK